MFDKKASVERRRRGRMWLPERFRRDAAMHLRKFEKQPARGCTPLQPVEKTCRLRPSSPVRQKLYLKVLPEVKVDKNGVRRRKLVRLTDG